MTFFKNYEKLIATLIHHHFTISKTINKKKFFLFHLHLLFLTQSNSNKRLTNITISDILQPLLIKRGNSMNHIKDNELEIINLEKTSEEKISKLKKIGIIGLEATLITASLYTTFTTTSMMTLDEMEWYNQIALMIPTITSLCETYKLGKYAYNEIKEQEESELEIIDFNITEKNEHKELKKMGKNTWDWIKGIGAVGSILFITNLIKDIAPMITPYQLAGLIMALSFNVIHIRNLDNKYEPYDEIKELIKRSEK